MPPSRGGGLKGPSLRATSEVPFLQFSLSPFKGVARLPFTARIERTISLLSTRIRRGGGVVSIARIEQPPLHRGGSASTETMPAVSPPLQARLSLHREAWLILECARWTSTFRSCAFREQEDDQAARLMLGLPPMCGRFTQMASPAVIAQEFDVAVPSLFTPRYNIAPSPSRFQPGGSTVVGTQSKGGAT